MDEIDDIIGKYAKPKSDDVDDLIERYAPPPKPITPSAEGPYREGYKRAPATSVPRLPAPDTLPKPAPSQGEAAWRGAASGFTANNADEIHGLASLAARHYLYAGASGDGLRPHIGEPASLEKHYVKPRDEYRARDKEAAKDWPKTFTGTQLGGALATMAAGGPVLQGAAAGLGASEADLTKGEVAGVAADTGVGAAIGGAIGLGGKLAGGAVKKVATAIKGDIKRRILNEVAEGTASTTATGRKRIDKAGENIVEEVVKGKDAAKVRGAYLGDADKGRKALEPIIGKVARSNERAYGAFEKAGRATVDPDEYMRLLELRRLEAAKAGQTRTADAIKAFQDRVLKNVDDTGSLDLAQLRGLTTEAQGIASSVLGSLNEHQNAAVARRMAAIVTEAMSDTIAAAAKGDKALEAAAVKIAKNNKRLNALLTVDDALRLRAYKENTGPGWLVSRAKKLTGPSALAGVGSVVGGEEDKLRNAAIGGAIGLGAVPLARAAERSITTAAIKALQGKSPIRQKTAEAAGRLAGRIGGGAYASSKLREDE